MDFQQSALGEWGSIFHMKICVYAISKNEELFVERFCNAAIDADLIIIADTGSTDRTRDLAEQFGATVHEICITPWRFDDARNAALSLVPSDVDVCVSLDLDEELQPGWREEIERVWTAGTTRLRYGFDWGAGIVFKYEKIHARNGYRWVHPCHEYPVPYLIDEHYAETDMLMVIHKPDPTKSRGQYLPLLEMSVREDPHDPRNAFYYARELSFHSQWQKAIDECNRYLALPGATWANERCYAYRVMSRCYSELGDWESAMKMARLGVVEAPMTREPWCEIAKLAYQRQMWAECYGAAKSALAIEHRELVYTVDPEVWGYMPHDYASIAAWHLRIYDEAISQAGMAFDKKPDDIRLKTNLEFVKNFAAEVA
jgi:glycosyltransferase involved in cell wall biosynthesis